MLFSSLRCISAWLGSSVGVVVVSVASREAMFLVLVVFLSARLWFGVRPGQITDRLDARRTHRHGSGKGTLVTTAFAGIELQVRQVHKPTKREVLDLEIAAKLNPFDSALAPFSSCSGLPQQLGQYLP